VIVPTPVYPPFFSAVTHAGRKLAACPLVADEGFALDLDLLQRQARTAKLVLWCSPHNPTGRVWRADELEAVAAIVRDNGLRIVSDEIHADFTYGAARHIPLASLDAETAAATITCTAPSKTFNIAGLQLAATVIDDGPARAAFRAQVAAMGLDSPPALGLVGAEAAYREGDAWVDALLAYLERTMAMIASCANAHPDLLRFAKPQGTYMAWLDLRALGRPQAELVRWVEEEAGLWLGDGRDFGDDGEGWLRMTAAVPHGVIQVALAQLSAALDRLA